MKKRPEEGDIYRGKNFDTCLDQRVWTVKSIFTPFQAVQWSLISVTRCGELLQLSSDTCECVWHMGGWRNDTTQFMSGAKELGLCVLLWHLQLITQLNRFLALQALVEGLGIWRATLGLKLPILLNWVKLRPGIWDGGAISSTGRCKHYYIQIQVIKMNLFNQLNQRYGQSYIEEVRSWEGKEQKLARHKCHLHFNLRCLSQNMDLCLCRCLCWPQTLTWKW